MRTVVHLPRAATVLVVLAALVIPATAAAHSSGLGSGDRPIDEDAAARHASDLADALATLPRETARGQCSSTEHVDGLGDACRTDDGAFRVALANGVTVTTHGTDAPLATESRDAAAPHLPDSQAAIDGASVADIECTSAPGDRRVELVYARPSDKPDRSATLATPMRDALYQASAFIDAEAQALDATQGRRIRALCADGGVPVVHSVTVRASGAGGGDYGDIVDDLVAQGFPAPTSSTTSTRRFMVFYDDQATNGAAGIGGMWLDDGAGVGNLNNLGGRYAVEFDWAASRLPHWDVFLHEISHNMGAVADAAPRSSQAGHCNDGLDVMCYSDGGSGIYSPSVCSVERYDCGGDTYFNPSPATGSWLATHWNVGSANNLWLAPRDLGWDDGGVPDLTAPPAPGAPAASDVTTTAITVSWGASVDDRSTVRYRVLVDQFLGDAWQAHSTWMPISQTSLTVTALTAASTYRFRVSAYDQAGNSSPESSVQAATLATPPIAPSSVGATAVDEDSVSTAWVAGSATLGVRGYDLELQRNSDAWTRVGEFAGTQTQIDGLAAGTNYRTRVRTIANGGVVSGWRTSMYVTTRSAVLAGGEGTLETPTVTVTPRSPTLATAAWTASPGAGSWQVWLTNSSGTRRTFSATSTSMSLSGLTPGALYSVGVVAISAAGNNVSNVGVATYRAPRDLQAPGMSRFLAPRYVRTSMRVTWRAATDNAGIRKYQLQRRVGRRWVNVPVRLRARYATVTRVRRGSVTVLRVRAIDVGGNAGRWTTTRIRRR